MTVWRNVIGAFAATAIAVAGSSQTQAQAIQWEYIAVTLFDARLNPYKALGKAEVGGAVVIFDGMLPSAVDLSPAMVAPTAIAPPPPDLGPPLTTDAGQGTQAQSGADAPTAKPEIQDPSDPVAGKHYADGVYAVNSDYLLSYPMNAYRILSAPARFDESDWITAALVASATGALLMLDEPLMDFWRDDIKSGFTGNVSDVVQVLGERTDILAGTVGGYLVAELLDSTGLADTRREKSAALLSLESFALAHGFVGGLKVLTGRRRPDNTDESSDFQGPGAGDFNASFPSGHAGGAFAVAATLSEIYGYDNPWVPYLAYTLATGTALSRVDNNRHWFSDVFFSSVIGYVVGKTVTRYSPFMARNNLTLRPFSQDDGGGIGLAYKF